MKKLLYSFLITIAIFFAYSSNAYAITYSANGTSNNGSIQNYTVPSTGSYQIEAWGAGGATSACVGIAGGLGAYMKGTFSLTAGQVLKILVGQTGDSINSRAGGGGGTFVTDNSNNPLIVAGGGGGGGSNCSGNQQNASTSTSGQTPPTCRDGKGGTSGGGGGGGDAGSGGGGGGLLSNGGTGCIGAYAGSGGAGGSGTTAGSSGGCGSLYYAIGGTSFTSGGTGGVAVSNAGANGGYGGGGSAYTWNCGGGGGGGYSGGGGGGSCDTSGIYHTCGGGGGSYISPSATSTTSTAGVQSGNGQVIITPLGGGGGGAIALRASTTGTASGVSSVTINVPAGTTVGDVLVAGIFANANWSGILGVSVPAGWTQVQKIDGSGSMPPAIGLYYHIVTGAEPGSYTWNFSNYSAGAYGGGWIAAFTGVDTTAPIDASGGLLSTSTTAYLTANITTTAANDMLVWNYAGNCASSFTTPTGASIISNAITGGCTTGSGFFKTQTSAGATGNIASSASASSYGGSDILALRPKSSVTTVATNGWSYNSFNVGITTTTTHSSYFGAKYSTSNTGSCSTWTDSGPALYVGVGTYTNYYYTVSNGVQPSTSYYYCAYVYDQTTGTTTYGQIYSPPVTTNARPSPLINMYGPMLSTDTSAVIGAGVNSYGAASTGFFRWQQTSVAPASCASMPNVTTTVSTGSYDGQYYPVTYQMTVSPGQKYYYCFQASNTNPTPGYGAVQSFTAQSTAGTGCTLFPSSSLATGTNETTMKTWLGTSKVKGTLIYKATVNGWTSVNFHTAVDGKGPAIMLVSANGKVFGHYNSLGWNSSSAWTAGTGAFLFNFTDNYKLNQQNYADYMFYGYNPYGPYIGGGFELGISGSPLNAAWTNNTGGHTYQAPSSQGAYTYLSGIAGPIPTEIEVYSVGLCTAPPVVVATTGSNTYTASGFTATGTVDPSTATGVVYAVKYGSSSAGITGATACSALPSTTAFSTTPLVAGSGVNSVSAPVTGLTPGSFYYFCIVAKDGVGNMSYSPTTKSVNAVNVTKQAVDTGSGGTVSSTPPDTNINCTSTGCSFVYPSTGNLQLTAYPDASSSFVQWTGVTCNEGATSTVCTFNLSVSAAPVAQFGIKKFTFTLNKNGGSGAATGTGLVQSINAGTGVPDGFINCNSSCATASHIYNIGSTVTLNASPDPTATFAGWTGAGVSCSEGSNTTTRCTVTVNTALTVTANFASVGYTGDATFYFGNASQSNNCGTGNGAKTTPALEVVLVAGSPSTPSISKYLFDPCNRVAGTLGVSSALTTPFQGVNFSYKATVPAIVNGLIMKVIPLYSSTIVGIEGTTTFPPQGKVIQSTGTSGDSARKIIYYESYPQIPNEVFPYSILSQ